MKFFRSVLALALALCCLAACGAPSTSSSGSSGSSVSTGGSSAGSVSSSGGSSSGDVSSSGSQGQVASSSQMAPAVSLDTEGLTPVTAADLKDGTYAIQVESSSSMFPIASCELTVSEGAMTATLTMGGKGYLYLYPGTAEEAAAAPETDRIPFEENAEGAQTYTVPVSALNAGVPCAAFSKNKELWYDRTLLFRADALPLDAYAEGFLTTPASLNLADGTYTVEVSLEGGSGKASVESPATLTVSDGSATATIVWSSSNYDYMVVDETRYELINTEGNSTFEIPVAFFDFSLPVRADTIAMSTPHEISYSLRFDSATLQSAS